MHISAAQNQPRVVDRELKVAQRLLEASQLDPEDHVLLRESVATCLHHLKPEFVQELEATPQERLLFLMKRGYANGDMRWTRKIFRDLEKPYSDRQVVERVERFESDFRRQAEEIAAEHQPHPCRFFVTGSLLKGRFGGNSDLDVVCEVEKPKRSQGYGDISVMFSRDGEAMAKGFGSYREVDPEQSGALRELFQEGLAAKGYLVSDTGICAPEGVERRREEAPASSMIWDFSSLP